MKPSRPTRPAVHPLRARGLALLLQATVAVAGCSESSELGAEPAPSSDGPDAAGASVACSGALFGAPTERTGLDASQCTPTCTCAGATFVGPKFDGERLAALRSWTLANPPAIVEGDPYAAPELPPIPEATVCGVLTDPPQKSYHVRSYDDETQAAADGAAVTHRGPCGLCSSLEDLAVYAGVPDLTAPVRECGVRGLTEGFETLVACLEAIGFTEPCASIWAYNVQHTREACLDVCLELLDAPYHLPNGQLNDCLACDETESGPVFKRIAGRTRRNTGIASALCRPCAEVVPLAHRY